MPIDDIANTEISVANVEIYSEYSIFIPGDTDFISIGAANNDVGTVFYATAVGSGTGQVRPTGRALPIVTANNIQNRYVYEIYYVGNSDFTSVGASNNQIGVTFMAWADGTSGSGLVLDQFHYIPVPPNTTPIDSDALYSYNGEYPKKLPFRIRLNDGTTRTDPTQFIVDYIDRSDYYLAPEQPTYNVASQELSWQANTWIIQSKTKSYKTIISKGDFIDRFDSADQGEQDKIYDILDSPANTLKYRTIRKGWNRLMADDDGVNLQNPLTQYMVNFLETEGVLNYNVTPGDLNRANTILRPTEE